MNVLLFYCVNFYTDRNSVLVWYSYVVFNFYVQYIVEVRAVFLLYLFVQYNLLYFYVQLNNFVWLNFYVKYQNDIKLISPKRTKKCTSQKYTCIYYKYTYSDSNRQQKTKRLYYFSVTFWASCYRQKFDLQSMFIFITKCTLK